MVKLQNTSGGVDVLELVCDMIGLARLCTIRPKHEVSFSRRREIDMNKRAVEHIDWLSPSADRSLLPYHFPCLSFMSPFDQLPICVAVRVGRRPTVYMTL